MTNLFVNYEERIRKNFSTTFILCKQLVIVSLYERLGFVYDEPQLMYIFLDIFDSLSRQDG